MSISEQALLPWPGIAPGNHKPHSTKDAARIYRAIINRTPDKRLVDAAEGVSRGDHILDVLGIDQDGDVTGDQVRDYFDRVIDDVTGDAVVHGIGDRYAASVTGDGFDGIYDAAIVLTQLINEWPAPSAAPDASVAQHVVAALEVVLPANTGLRSAHITVTAGQVDEGEDIIVDYDNGDSDEQPTGVLDTGAVDVRELIHRAYPNLTGELAVDDSGREPTITVTEHSA